MSFIDASYFVGELTVPNTDERAVAERLSWFIRKYEPEFLQKLFGYPLYKAFLAGMTVVAPATPDIKWLNILYGAEYIDFQGYTQKWKGLLITDNPIYNLAGGYSFKNPEYLVAGQTVGLTPGINTAIFDGTAGTDDWRGWVPILYRNNIMRPGVDYSWDSDLGVLVLLMPNDKFGQLEAFFAQFLPKSSSLPAIDIAVNESCIADYVYYRFRRDGVTQYTGIGEVITKAENSINARPRPKIASIWNQMHTWTKEFVAFMEATQIADATIYPQWTNINKCDALKHFGFMNPYF